MQFSGNSLLFKDPSAVNSYVASALADFIRQKLLEAKKSFSFETVMSFPDKIALLRTAQDQGYKTYLYYVATEDPAINVVRVAYRVQRGGHSVPQDKITSRYYRSLELLLEAINASNRAYIFDNSGVDSILIAIITDGRQIEMKHSEIPNWFKKWVLNKLFVELEIPASM